MRAVPVSAGIGLSGLYRFSFLDRALSLYYWAAPGLLEVFAGRIRRHIYPSIDMYVSARIQFRNRYVSPIYARYVRPHIYRSGIAHFAFGPRLDDVVRDSDWAGDLEVRVFVFERQ